MGDHPGTRSDLKRVRLFLSGEEGKKMEKHRLSLDAALGLMFRPTFGGSITGARVAVPRPASIVHTRNAPAWTRLQRMAFPSVRRQTSRLLAERSPGRICPMSRRQELASGTNVCNAHEVQRWSVLRRGAKAQTSLRMLGLKKREL